MTQKTRANLGTSINTNLASGTNITAAELRPELKDIADSSFNLLSDTMDNIADGSSNRIFTAAEKTKLGTVASGATANSSDATLLDRANHTGTQAISTITNLQTNLDLRPTSDVTGIGGADQITNIISLTQAEYDAIGSKSATTLYVIVG